MPDVSTNINNQSDSARERNVRLANLARNFNNKHSKDELAEIERRKTKRAIRKIAFDPKVDKSDKLRALTLLSDITGLKKESESKTSTRRVVGAIPDSYLHDELLERLALISSGKPAFPLSQVASEAREMQAACAVANKKHEENQAKYLDTAVPDTIQDASQSSKDDITGTTAGQGMDDAPMSEVDRVLAIMAQNRGKS